MRTLQNPEKLKEVGHLYKEITRVNDKYVNYWKDNTLFHWDFWVSCFLLLAPIIFWVIFRKKESTSRLLYAGFFVLLISCWLDFMGVMFGKWYYTGILLPFIPSYLPWDVVIFPIFAMTLLQIKPKRSPFIKALIFSAVCAFIGEPLFIWFGFYVSVDWHIYYSFPIYFIIYLIAHKLSMLKNFEPI
jgi:hypothetical protein